jgi:hypothetical protein
MPGYYRNATRRVPGLRGIGDANRELQEHHGTPSHTLGKSSSRGAFKISRKREQRRSSTSLDARVSASHSRIAASKALHIELSPTTSEGFLCASASATL